LAVVEARKKRKRVFNISAYVREKKGGPGAASFMPEAVGGGQKRYGNIHEKEEGRGECFHLFPPFSFWKGKGIGAPTYSKRF